MAKLNLMDKPLAIELFPKDSENYIDIECRGPEKAKIANMTVREVVDYVMKNYRKSSLANTIKQDLDDILSSDNIEFIIANDILGIDTDSLGNVIADHTQTKINNSKYFTLQKDKDLNDYLLCQIRVYRTGDHDLGCLKKALYKW